MFDWRKKVCYNEPNDKHVQKEFWDWSNARSEIVTNWEKVILSKCKKNTVLDIGGWHITKNRLIPRIGSIKK